MSVYSFIRELFVRKISFVRTFEFYPLHVLHKPKRARRRRKIDTQEGTYQVNRNEKKVEQVRPIHI